MKTPTAPSPDALHFFGAITLGLTAISALVMLFGGPFPAVFEVLAFVSALAAWHQVWVYNRATRITEAPNEERITHS